MNIESIQEELRRLLRITQGWQDSGEVSAIERDIALDGVKRLYEQIAFAAAEPTTITETEESQEPEVEVELAYYEGEDEEDGDEPELEEQPQEEQEEEKEKEKEEPTFELGDISIIAEGGESSGDGMLFDMNDIPVRQKSRRSAILSLYNDAPAEPQTTKSIEPEPMPIEVVEEIQPAQPETITQRYASEVVNSTLGERGTIGASINDRYIIVQELFGGDMTAYEHLQDVLGRMSSFDDCMIHIVENYDWDAESEAVQLFITTLEQRFSK